MTIPKIVAVIPMRFRDCCLEEGGPRHMLDGRPLWAHTFEHALAAKHRLSRIIVAYDDERFAAHLQDGPDDLEVLLRPPYLSSRGVTALDVVAYVSNTLDGEPPDYLMLLEISHPLRPKGLIPQLVEKIAEDPVDSLITVHPVRYNFWRQDLERGMVRITGSGDDAAAAMYQEVIGIGSLFRPALLGTGNPYGEKVAMVPITSFWGAIDVGSDDGLWLAARYLEKLRRPTI